MFRKQQERLRRNIGILGNFAFGYADVAEGIYFTLGIVIIYARGAAAYAYLFATIAYVLTAICYAELASTYHVAGGAFVYANRAFGANTAFLAAWALLLDYVVTTAISSLAAIGYLSYFIPALGTPLYTGIATLVAISLLTGLNILGIAESAKFSYFLVIFDVIGEAIVLITGYFFSYRFGLNPISMGTNPSYPNFLYAITIAMSSYLGIEVISQSAGETKRPAKNIPRAVFLISAATVTATLAFSSLAMGVIHYNDFASNPRSVDDPVTFIASRLPYGWALGPLTALLGMSVLLVASNAGVVGSSRIVFAMSDEGVIPRIFGRLHKRYGTPFIAILVFSTISIILAFSGRIELVAELYNFGALIAYMIVGFSLVSLRNKEKDLIRPFKTPWYIAVRPIWRRWFKKNAPESQERYVIPVIGIAAIVSDLIIWLLVVILHPLGRTVGSLWMGIGLLIFFIYTRFRKQKISAPAGQT